MAGKYARVLMGGGGLGTAIPRAYLTLHCGQTSEAFFVLFSGILFNAKWKHGQRCIKQLVNVTIFSPFFF